MLLLPDPWCTEALPPSSLSSYQEKQEGEEEERGGDLSLIACKLAPSLALKEREREREAGAKLNQLLCYYMQASPSAWPSPAPCLGSSRSASGSR